MPVTPEGGFRFIPIEAGNLIPTTVASRQPPVRPNAQAPPGPPPFPFYPHPPPAQLPPPYHYNPQGVAHPYFFPPVLAHQHGAHFPIPPPPPPQNPLSPPTASPATDQPNGAASVPPTPSTPANGNNTFTKGDTPTAKADDVRARAQSAAAQTPAPDPNAAPPPVNINPRYPPKGQNTAARPLSHPNPEALGLTRLSPPPECHYPSSEVASTVVNAWARSRGFRLVRQKSDKNASGQTYKQYYLCTRHGKPTNTHKVTPETRQRKQRKSGRIGCPMGLVVRAVNASTPSGDWTVRWQLEGKSEWHNHGPVTQEEIEADKARADKNARRRETRGTGNGKRGRRPKDPDKPAKYRDRRKKKSEGESNDDGDASSEVDRTDGATAAATTGANGDELALDTAAPSVGGAQAPEQILLSQEHGEQLSESPEQQLQRELTRSLQEHAVPSMPQQQFPPQHQHQQHNTHLSKGPQVYPTHALPSLWGLGSNDILTQHRDRARLESQQQQQQEQQRQQQQSYQAFGFDQTGSRPGMGYR